MMAARRKNLINLSLKMYAFDEIFGRLPAITGKIMKLETMFIFFYLYYSVFCQNLSLVSKQT